MIKHIYEFKNENTCKAPCKNKYTVVYENKTYYYCKVNGRDELEKFYKDRENKRNCDGEFWSTNDFDVDEALTYYRDKRKKDSLQQINSQINYKQKEIDLLIKEKEFLEAMKE